MLKIREDHDVGVYIGVSKFGKLMCKCKDRNTEKEVVVEDKIVLPREVKLTSEAFKYFLISRMQEMYFRHKQDKTVLYGLDPSSIMLAMELRWNELKDFIEYIIIESRERTLTQDIKSDDESKITGASLESTPREKTASVSDIMLKVEGTERPGYLYICKGTHFQICGDTQGCGDYGSSIQWYDLTEIIQIVHKESFSLATMFVRTQMKQALINNGFTFADLDTDENGSILFDVADEIINFLK